MKPLILHAPGELISSTATLSLNRPRWYIADLRPPDCRLADVPSGNCLDEPTYAIFKPRNVLSASGADHEGLNRKTLTDVQLSAGLVPIPGHVGRLDYETSGLILVTSHGLLNKALLNWPDILTSYGGTPTTKRYRLYVEGRHEPDSTQVKRLSDPLTHSRNGRTFYSKSAVSVSVLGSFEDRRMPSAWSLFDSINVPSQGSSAYNPSSQRDNREPSARELWQASRRAARQQERLSKADTLPFPSRRLEGYGWVTQIDIVLSEGRHHQVRRLCKRAGLRLHHLRRLAVGPVQLGDLAPGEVRVLEREEKHELYAACLPRLLAAQRAHRESFGQCNSAPLVSSALWSFDTHEHINTT